MRRNYYILPLLAVLLLVGGCRKTVRKTRPAPTVTAVSVVRDIVVESVSIIGKVKAEDETDLVARVSGFLVKTNFSEGEEVKKGQLLFLIEQDQYKAALAKAEANLLTALATQKNADQDYERQKSLYLKRAVAK
ncbi:MAG: biotin/lipoyl-binding protein, partial [Victivallales bacterium]|nr:biotin/lipoyl-binding protein [Victivallales bacterium]